VEENNVALSILTYARSNH